MAWEIDARKSHAYFTAHQMTVGTVRRRVDRLRGYLHIDTQTPMHSWVDVAVDVASGEAGSHPSSREAGARSLLTFTSTRVEHVEGLFYTVTGDVTIHGVTRPVTFDTLLHGEHDGSGLWRAGLFARARVNRSEFGSALDRLGATLGGDTGAMTGIEIAFDLFQQSVAARELAVMAA